MTANDGLFSRIAAGDAEAASGLLNRYGSLVWSLVRTRIRNAAEAEDVAQEIFVDLWKYAGRFEPSLSSEAVFVATIARRRIVDRVRALTRQAHGDTVDDEQLPLLAVLEQEDRHAHAADVAAATRALDEIEAAQREVVLLAIVQGLSHAEIAQATGRTLGTVKLQLRRGLHRVRETLASRGTADEVAP